MLNHNEDWWQEKGAILTAKAIVAQPRLWKEGLERVKTQEEAIAAFWTGCENRHRIVITGAGSSLLAARSCLNWLRSVSERQIEVIPSTDLVLMPERMTDDVILVSVSSSGNTPETVRVVEKYLMSQPGLYHIAITNNAQSKLALLACQHPEGLFVPVPEGTSNGSFAATSEFTLPLWYLMLLLAPKRRQELENILPVLMRGAGYFLQNYASAIEQWATLERDNMVAVGALSLKAVACETSLKLLEMGNGSIMTAWHSMLEFRHGPKLIVNRDATILGYIAARPDLQRYDLDMMTELKRDRSEAAMIIGIGHDALPDEATVCDRYFHFSSPELAEVHESFTAMLYVLFAQLAGLYKAIAAGVTPDNPSHDGKVAKVAKVTVY
ncbi:silent information regulator protein Sir2 [Citrobacter amalonaticus]|uniref:Silent information regulator protein Sir2 n=1 Tax=Citrobacter amalonaticus TaxID=35703 RepID=A0A2S4RQ71_CITAM|nr:SIS domain-containing protein [Citrobacter amalonaticus]POT55346.1 silent information regulator protein Sir2 [Citrobacter amalonaticus]POT69037.1 silent information regulator protein Sir2 [Citrobacter amalonaticus]POU59264.1 silent information regulator protein Sir2 [Citrobacter amalonaticus]POV03417.1 silent information regulator protein Sir2 [Citrobacter amalonaticus]